MLDEHTTSILLALTGFGSGVSVGMGSGTASPLIIPFLTLLMGVSIHKAIGTSLLVDSAIGCIGGLLFLLNNRVNKETVLTLGIPGVTGAMMGGQLTSSASETGLNVFLGLIVIFIGVNFLVNGIQKNLDLIQNKIDFSWFKRNNVLFFVVFGLLLGVVSGFIGIGVGGIIALILIFVVQYDVHTAIGTSLLIMTFIAGSGAITHLYIGEVALEIAAVAIGGAAIGALTGSIFANKINSELLGRILGAIILVLGVVITLRTLLL